MLTMLSASFDMAQLRRTLSIVVVLASILAFSALFFVARDGAISHDNLTKALASFGTLYSPLATGVAAYLFATKKRKRASHATVDLATAFIALLVTIVWLLAPVGLLLVAPIEDIIAWTQQWGWFGIIVNSVFVFFFALDS